MPNYTNLFSRFGDPKRRKFADPKQMPMDDNSWVEALDPSTTPQPGVDLGGVIGNLLGGKGQPAAAPVAEETREDAVAASSTPAPAPTPTVYPEDREEAVSLTSAGNQESVDQAPLQPYNPEQPANGQWTATERVTDPTLTGSRKALQDYENLKAAPKTKEKSLFRRLGSGVIQGFKIWQESGGQGGLGGLLGAVATGGIGSAVSPGFQADLSRHNDLKKLFRKYGDEREVETAEMGRMKEIAATQKAAADSQKAEYQYRAEMAKQYIDAANQKGYMEASEVDHIKNTYGIDITNPNNGRFATETRNGRTYIRRVNEPDFVLNPTVPVELSDAQIDTEIGDVTVPLKPGQAASTAVGLAQNEARAVERQEVREQTREDKIADQTTKSFEQDRKERIDAETAKAKYATALEGLIEARNAKVAAGDDTGSLDAAIANAKGEMSAAETRLKQKPVTQSTNKNPPAGKRRAPTEKEARIHLENQGKTAAEIEAIIRKNKGRFTKE
jgi:hypothetical protein